MTGFFLSWLGAIAVEKRGHLPEGVPSSLPWLLGLILFPVAALLLDIRYLFQAGSPAAPLVVVGLSMVAVLTASIAAIWLWTRHSHLVEYVTLAGSVAEEFAREDSLFAGEGKISPRLAGPFPVMEDDELGFLAARLNGLALALRQAVDAADGERSQMNKILASMDSGVILTDPAGRVLLVNGAAERLLGRSAEALLRRTVLESLLQPELADRVQDAASRGETGSVPLHLDSSHRHVLAMVSPVGDGSAPNGAVIVLQDQEEQRRLDSVRRDFIANVSHELRTPLASIRAMAETLLMGAREDPKVAEPFLQVIVDEADRLATLTNDILDLARYESGRLELLEIQLGDLLSEVERQVRPAAARAGLDLRSEIVAMPVIVGDSAALRQVFLNLLDNAVKYTPAGHVTLAAGPAVMADNGGQRTGAYSDAHGSGSAIKSWVKVEVSDSGPGISPEYLPRIFERFYRVDRARARDLGGTGLGLSIARHVTEAHGGHIEVQSAAGEGITFTVWLPGVGER